MFQHSRNYLIWVIELINSLLASSFRSDQYQNHSLNRKKMRSSFSHIQRCSDQFWWRIDWDDFWIFALSSHVRLSNAWWINILFYDRRNISSSKDKDDFDWFEVKSCWFGMKSCRFWVKYSYDSVCQWRMFRTFRWLNSSFDKWLLTISDHWSDRLVNHLI